MPAERDPRVYFAAERTLLAWVRTGIAVIGLGFVVARFGLFVRVMQPMAPVESSWSTTALGTLLVVFGSAAILLAAVQHFRFARELDQLERPRAYWTTWPILLAAVIALIGMLLAVQLVGQPH